MEHPTQLPEEDRPRYEGWRVAGASAVSVFLASLVVYTFAILLKPLSEEFAWSREAVSSAYGITALMSALCAAPFGYLCDRWGPRKIIILCSIVFGVSLASLAALTPRLEHLYFVYAVLGIVATGMSPVVYARAVFSWFDRRRGLALALAISGSAVGAMVHPPIMQSLIRSMGWRSACVSLGVAVLAIGLPIVVRYLRERPLALSAPVGGRASDAAVSLGQGLATRVFWILVLVLFSSSMALNAAIVHLPALLTDRGVSASRAALALSAMGLASVVGRIATGWLMDRFFAARVSFGLLAIAAAGTLLLSVAHSFPTGMLAAILIGFGMGGEADVTPYLISRYFGLRSFGALFGFTWIAVALAGAIGPVLMGRAFDVAGSYETVLIRLAIGTMVAAALMLTLPRYASTPASSVEV